MYFILIEDRLKKTTKIYHIYMVMCEPRKYVADYYYFSVSLSVNTYDYSYKSKNRSPNLCYIYHFIIVSYII